LQGVLRQHPKRAFEPGARDAYSNLSYWSLGQVIEVVARGHVRRRSALRLAVLLTAEPKVLREPAGKWSRFEHLYMNGAAYGGARHGQGVCTRIARRAINSNLRVCPQPRMASVYRSNQMRANNADIQRFADQLIARC
jgi:hypothetical protein